MTKYDDTSMSGSAGGADSPENAPSGAASVGLGSLNVSLRTSQRPLLLAVLAVCVVAGAAYGISYFRGRPDPIREIFAAQIPGWQLQRGKGWIPAGGTEILAMQSALRRYPEVSSALGRLDAAYPDPAAVKTAGQGLSDALFASHLPYYLDPQPIQKKTILLSYSVVGQATWSAGPRSILVRRLLRLDKLNVEIDFLGQTGSERSIVFLDRIESSLINDLLDAAGKRKESSRRRSLTDADHAALYELRRALAVRVGEAALDSVVAALTARDEAFETMRRRLHDGKVRIEKPDSFVFSDSWFESLWPLSSLQNPGGPLILDTDLRAVETADAQLRTREATTTINTLLDLMALGTEAHEARHAFAAQDSGHPPDAAPPAARPVPDALAALVGDDPDFAVKADGELRAYLGEIHDASSAPCFSIVQGIRQVRGRYVPRTPHFFAQFLILGRLGGDEGLADPVGLVHRLCAEPEPDLRARAAALWKDLYGSEMVPARREPR